MKYERRLSSQSRLDAAVHGAILILLMEQKWSDSGVLHAWSHVVRLVVYSTAEQYVLTYSKQGDVLVTRLGLMHLMG